MQAMKRSKLDLALMGLGATALTGTAGISTLTQRGERMHEA
jgi:hypothetical protein